MSINLHLPSHMETLKPKITVVGVGGAGGNAVNNMIAANLEGVDFVMANTDAQALENAMTDRAIQMGATTTQGLGAGASPDIGRAAAEEALEEIASHTEGSNMVFITAGMGGGTGTGAAPVIAQLSREQGILTVGVVTKPFHFEGTHRMKIAEEGIKQLQQYVDTLIVIPNQNLFRVANEKTTFADAFRMADEVLHSGVRGVTDLIVKPGLVNLDFADIRAVMSEMGKAMMGTGEAEGEKRAIDAAESAISNPLLDDVSLKGATGVLINITGGPDMTLFEVDEAANRIRDEVDTDANIIFGSTFSDQMEGRMRVSVVATGIDLTQQQQSSSVTSIATAVKKKDSEGAARRKVDTSAYRKAEPKRERSAAEIVREAGTASINDIAKQMREAKKEPEPAKEDKLFTPLLLDEEPVQLSIEDYEPEVPQEVEVKESSASRRRPLRLGELKEQLDTPLFVSPKAEQPASRPYMKSDASQEEDEEDDILLSESSGLSFFRKIAGVRKSLSGNSNAMKLEPEEDEVMIEEDDPAMPRKAKVREKVPVAAEEDGEDYLDIPAFLRRQAN